MQIALPWNSDVLEYYNLNRTVRTSSILQIKKKLYLKSVGTWKKYSPYLLEPLKKLKDDIANLDDFDSLSFQSSINWHFDVDFEYYDGLL